MEATRQEQAITAAIVVPDAAKTALQQFWKENSKQIAAVTAGTDTERIMRITYSVLYRNPKLIQCTRFSLLNGIVLAHQLGLVFGTQECALVPYGKEATLIVQYAGKVKLALASKLITSVYADVVLDGEPFVFEVNQSGLQFSHKPNLDDRPEPTPENVRSAYCQLTTASGGVQTRLVSRKEILSARLRSRGYRYQMEKGGTDNPWFSDFGAMCLKTAVHRAMKLAPQDARLGLATAIDDEEQGAPAVIAEGLNPADFGEKDLTEPLLTTGKEAAQEVALNKLLEGIKKSADGLGVIGGLFSQLKQYGERGESLYANVMERNGLPLSPNTRELTVEKARDVIKGLWAAIELAKAPESAQTN